MVAAARTPNQPGQPLQLLEAKIVHQGQTIVVHQRSAGPLVATWEQNPHSKLFKARVEMPLGDNLTWVEDSTVTLEAVVKLPWEPGEIHLKRQFEAEHTKSSSTIFDYWMSI